MVINLSKDYRIRTDENNYILEKVHVSQKTGNPYYTQLGFYGSLERAINEVVDYQIKTSELEGLTELKGLMHDTAKEIEHNVTVAINSKQETI